MGSFGAVTTANGLTNHQNKIGGLTLQVIRQSADFGEEVIYFFFSNTGFGGCMEKKLTVFQFDLRPNDRNQVVRSVFIQ